MVAFKFALEIASVVSGVFLLAEILRSLRSLALSAMMISADLIRLLEAIERRDRD